MMRFENFGLVTVILFGMLILNVMILIAYDEEQKEEEKRAQYFESKIGCSSSREKVNKIERKKANLMIVSLVYVLIYAMYALYTMQ